MKALAVAFIFATTVAQAQTTCGALADMLANLKRQYGEEVSATGNLSTDKTMLITVNPKTGTWTAMVVKGDMACLRAFGDGWQVVPPGAPA